MNKVMILLGASAFALGLMSDGAEAKKRTYEIDGQRFTYDTKDPDQVALARKRIEAANAADAAKAKADAEKAATPLVEVFGSPVQREAAEAQAKLQQALAEQGEPVEPVKRVEARSRATKTSDEQPNETAGSAPVKEQVAALEQPRPVKPAEAPRPRIAEPVTIEAAPGRKVKAISFDVEAGTKTTVMADGAVEEEPFDTAMLARLIAESGQGSLSAFVQQLRKASEETTGAIRPRIAQPDLTSQAMR